VAGGASYDGCLCDKGLMTDGSALNIFAGRRGEGAIGQECGCGGAGGRVNAKHTFHCIDFVFFVVMDYTLLFSRVLLWTSSS